MKFKDYVNKKNNIKNYIYSLFKRILVTSIIVLLVLILCKKKEEYKTVINKNLFETNFDFSKVNNIYKKYILGEVKELTSLVSNNKVLDYTSKETYKDGVLLTLGKEYPIKALDSGLVVYVGEKDNMNTIIIQQSNGIDVTYSNINASVKVYDYIEKGNIIGSTNNEKLYLSFSKDGEILNFEPYIES